MVRKGLALIYDPHNVYQFLWYYCTYGKEMEWDALCLPNSYKGEYLSPLCEKLGIFKKIYTDDKPFDLLPMKQKFFIFLKMLWYALFFQQKRFAKKFLKNYVDVDEYDTVVVLTDVGFISGLFLTFGKEKEIVILEDGMGDYAVRKYSNLLKNFHHFYDIQGSILAFLGYSNIGHDYPLRTTKNCTKFSSHTEKLHYKKYKEMKTLFDMEHTDDILFKKFISIIYPNLEKYFEKKVDLILFTTPFLDYTKNTEKYACKVENYINSHFSSVLIKRHPRDTEKYTFADNVHCEEIDQAIPAEVLLPYLAGKTIIFCDHSSTTLYMSAFGYKPYFFYFSTLEQESKTETSVMCTYKTEKEFCDRLKHFNLSTKNIIIIE